MGNFVWTARHEQHLRTLHDRYAIHQGRGKGPRGRNLSERQYVIQRMREMFAGDFDRFQVSDQAIWAKYLRTNGKMKARAAAPGAPRVAPAPVFPEYRVEGTGILLVSGLRVPDFRNYFEKLGLKQLGQGATRTVFDLGDNRVVKVTHKGRNPEMASRHNRTEAGHWQKFGNTDFGQYLAPVRAVDNQGWWLVMDKAIPSSASNKPHNFFNELIRQANRHNLRDIHAGNYGVTLDGERPVMIDYADGI